MNQSIVISVQMGIDCRQKGSGNTLPEPAQVVRFPAVRQITLLIIVGTAHQGRIQRWSNIVFTVPTIPVGRKLWEARSRIRGI